MKQKPFIKTGSACSFLLLPSTAGTQKKWHVFCICWRNNSRPKKSLDHTHHQQRHSDTSVHDCGNWYYRAKNAKYKVLLSPTRKDNQNSSLRAYSNRSGKHRSIKPFEQCKHFSLLQVKSTVMFSGCDSGFALSAREENGRCVKKRCKSYDCPCLNAWLSFCHVVPNHMILSRLKNAFPSLEGGCAQGRVSNMI